MKLFGEILHFIGALLGLALFGLLLFPVVWVVFHVLFCELPK